MANSRRGNAGGRANEGGSSHRAGLATYFAAHGLADVPVRVADGASPGTPTLLWFETSSAVDDLRCQFTGGHRWDLQAKRACSWGARFDAVVEQWVAAARTETLTEGDRLVLACGGLSAPLRSLGMALRRLRESSDGELLPEERRQYLRLRNLAARQGWSDVMDVVVRYAAIIDVKAETEHDAAFREAAALLDGTVVARGSGLTALNVLARYFQTEAGRAGASRPEQWLRVLDEAGVKAGPASARASAGRTRQLANYRNRLSARLDILEIDHLAGGVSPMPITDLLGSFYLQLPSANPAEARGTSSLAHIARRWPKFAFLGLPGAGKSTAMEQLAAAWAADVQAPLPILVRMHMLVTPLRNRERVGVEKLVAIAEEVSDDIVPVLVERIAEGTASILLDGLDECRDQQGAAASLVRQLLDDLHPDCGLILSSRDAASDMAQRTGLPLASLEEPQHLQYRVRSLVDHVAGAVKADPADAGRARTWVEESQAAHPDIWRVPLLAVLLAVHAAQAPSGQLPASRAAALVAAVQDSVRRWERQKADHPVAWSPDLHPQLLIDGFAAIGHAVALGDTDLQAATAAVAEAVAGGWDYATARANAVADDILRWWLDRVGAFTLSDGSLRARVRLMGEIGDAMWAVGQPPERRRAWIESVLADLRRMREPALLAAALNPIVCDELLELCVEPEAVLLAAEAVGQGAKPSDGALEVLLRRLAHLASHPPDRPLNEPKPTGSPSQLTALMSGLDDRRQRADGPSWRYFRALVVVPWPPALRPLRDGALAHLADVERSTVAKSLAAFADCLYDKREPTEAERDTLRALLALPVPDTEPVTYQRSRRHLTIGTSDPLLSGRTEAVAHAIRLVGLTSDTAPLAARLATQASVRSAEILRSEIRRAGFAEEAANVFRSKFPTVQRLLNGDHDRDDMFILQEAAGASPVRCTPPTCAWRLTAISALLEVLGPGKHQIGTSIQAIEQYPDVVAKLVRLALAATGYAVERIADEAERALELLEADPLGTAVLLHTHPDPARTFSVETPRIGVDSHSVLKQCVTSGNDWLFWLAVEWLAASGEDGLALLWQSLHAMAPRHRLALADWLAEAVQRPESYGDWISGDDPPLRLAGAYGLVRHGTDPAQVQKLVSDQDLMVRLEVLRALAKSGPPEAFEAAAALALTSAPDAWTCRWCGCIESIRDWDCTSCTVGDRPDLAEEIQRQRKALVVNEASA